MDLDDALEAQGHRRNHWMTYTCVTAGGRSLLAPGGSLMLMPCAEEASSPGSGAEMEGRSESLGLLLDAIV